jgi:DnaJ-class molecular chaperone
MSGEELDLGPIEEGEEIICPRCDGLGWIPYYDGELGEDEYECPDCKGTGYLDKEDLGKLKTKDPGLVD